jgi:hypothetical protein
MRSAIRTRTIITISTCCGSLTRGNGGAASEVSAIRCGGCVQIPLLCPAAAAKHVVPFQADSRARCAEGFCT